MQKLPYFVAAVSHQLKPLACDGSQFARMLFHPSVDRGIPLSRAIESQQFRFHPCSFRSPAMTVYCFWLLYRRNSCETYRTDILNRDFAAGYKYQDPASPSEGLAPRVCSVAGYRLGASVVACRADPGGSTLDRPANNRSSHAAPGAGLDSPQAISRTLHIHSPQSNFARPPARRNRRGGHELLPSPRIRLAADPNRCGRRFGRRAHSRSFYHYAATRKEFILRNGPLFPPKRSRGHTGAGGRTLHSANSAFWRSTSTWSNGAPAFMVRIQLAVTTTRPHRAISAGNNRHVSLQFCRLR